MFNIFKRVNEGKQYGIELSRDWFSHVIKSFCLFTCTFCLNYSMYLNSYFIRTKNIVLVVSSIRCLMTNVKLISLLKSYMAALICLWYKLFLKNTSFSLYIYANETTLYRWPNDQMTTTLTGKGHSTTFNC